MSNAYMNSQTGAAWTGSAQGHQCLCFDFQFSVFMRFLSLLKSGSLTQAFSCTFFFLLLVCLFQLQCDSFYFIPLYFILLYFKWTENLATRVNVKHKTVIYTCWETENPFSPVIRGISTTPAQVSCSGSWPTYNRLRGFSVCFIWLQFRGFVVVLGGVLFCFRV